MEHAARLDLSTYEDPAFHDTLERARAQATDRITMIHALGALLQQMVTVVSLSASIAFFSPWLLVLLVLAVVPAFLGESHFAFLGYSLNIQQTPTRRRLDYLRVLGASKESAKELKLFGLAPFVTGEYAHLSDELYDQNVALARRRLSAGALLSLISTGSYYGAYAYVIYRTVNGDLSWGDLQFLAGALAGASGGIQSLFATFSNIADQSLFLTDLVEFFKVQPTIRSKPRRHSRAAPDARRLRLRERLVRLPGNSRLVLDRLNLRIGLGERIALVGANGQGKTTLVKLLTRLYDPTAGRILLDGVDLRDYGIEDLHREIGVIFQDFMRYDMTARQNIAVGRIDDRSARRRDRAGGAQEPGERGHFAGCRRATTSCSAAASKAAWICRAASGRRLRSRAPTCATRSCWSSTNRRPRSTPAPSTRFPALRRTDSRARRRCSSLTGSPPSAWRTASSSSPTGGSPNRVLTRICSDGADSTRKCSSCRRPAIADLCGARGIVPFVSETIGQPPCFSPPRRERRGGAGSGARQRPCDGGIARAR